MISCDVISSLEPGERPAAGRRRVGFPAGVCMQAHAPVCMCVCVCMHACARECVELLLGDRGVWGGEVAQLGLLFKEIVSWAA